MNATNPSHSKKFQFCTVVCATILNFVIDMAKRNTLTKKLKEIKLSLFFSSDENHILKATIFRFCDENINLR